ncbi:hypothetical protein BD410DRAFT_728472 [Rickenella mellea]|uniref:UbiA prenyltransferase n=1 Tax=Rickenella mellea TaxID=50990 RepID=A0A4Y7PVB9_9AGAM|nr:hypothetical protein BD410DRAFT_728472 [Rickenella mellea]
MWVQLRRSARTHVASVKGVAWTLFLFTYTDYKTIFFPVTAFACVAAPVQSYTRLLHGVIWIWLNLLQCNSSNQYKSAEEDALNRPWRPLPSGRISRSQASKLRWSLVPICIGFSACYGWDVVLANAFLTLTTIMYDELGFAGHWLGKNFCNIFGYVTFEIGATKIIGTSTALDYTAMISILYSALVIFTTIQTQDFPDVIGDSALGRVTIPIKYPEASRKFTFVAMIAWSVFFSSTWALGTLSSLIFCVLGAYVGSRIYLLRTVQDDKRSYVIYNVWLLIAHLLPAQTRWNVLPF